MRPTIEGIGINAISEAAASASLMGTTPEAFTLRFAEVLAADGAAEVMVDGIVVGMEADGSSIALRSGGSERRVTVGPGAAFRLDGAPSTRARVLRVGARVMLRMLNARASLVESGDG
jgi:hypothetical protein